MLKKVPLGLLYVLNENKYQNILFIYNLYTSYILLKIVRMKTSSNAFQLHLCRCITEYISSETMLSMIYVIDAYKEIRNNVYYIPISDL